MSVRVEKNGPITTVILARSEVRNAEEALLLEFQGGLQVLESESLPGASRFARGAGRHGRFE